MGLAQMCSEPIDVTGTVTEDFGATGFCNFGAAPQMIVPTL